MNELKRTAIFVITAVVLTAISLFTMPSIKDVSPASMVGEPLFPDFTDPQEATSLEVVKFDKDTATAKTFKVAKIGNSWVIPSHSNYPADAKDQLAEVAAEWVDLKVLSVATDPAESGIGSNDIGGLHKLYGVVDPVGEDTSDPEGVGTRVVMRDKDDKEVVRLIMGKEVEDQQGLHYVRVIGQEPVYTVKASTSKLSTKFEDWIEDDLLKLSSWDIRNVNIDDYSIDILQGTLTPRGQLSFDYNDTGDPRWKLVADRSYTEKGWVEHGLGENEELNTETLNNLKSALDDLKIVDVRRKPKGLSETLKSSGSINLDPEAKSSLSRAGFHVIPVSDPSNPGRTYYDLRSNEGEISAGMKDGVTYVLRFGQIASMDGGGDEAEETKADEGEKKDDSTDSKVNRYLFVTATMDRRLIKEPTYEELPELPSEETQKDDSKDGASEEAKVEESKDAKPEQAKEADKEKAADAETEEAKADEKKPEKADAAEAEKKPDEADAAEVEKKADEKPEEPKPTREEIEKKREQIQKENDRKKEEYEEKIKEGEERVKDLNARFADWYYVINNEEYQKIHLGRDKVVKEKEKKEEEEAKKDGEAPKAPAFPGMEPNSVGDLENLKLNPPAEK